MAGWILLQAGVANLILSSCCCMRISYGCEASTMKNFHLRIFLQIKQLLVLKCSLGCLSWVSCQHFSHFHTNLKGQNWFFFCV